MICQRRFRQLSVEETKLVRPKARPLPIVPWRSRRRSVDASLAQGWGSNGQRRERRKGWRPALLLRAVLLDVDAVLCCEAAKLPT